MKHLLFFIALLFAVFLNTNIAPSLGFEKITTTAFMPMMLYIAFSIFTQKLRYDKETVHVILLAAIILIFKWAIGQNYFKEVAQFLIIPMLISICFENLNKKESILLFRIIIILYITECGLSIVEWILKLNFFASEELIRILTGALKMGFFRSTALYGHPLSNAQIVAVFMAFIAISNFKKKYIQVILFFLGYVSLFCFGARGATMVVTVFTVPYFIWKINKTTPQSRKWIIKLGILCMFCGMIYMVTQTDMGGRVMNLGVNDEGSSLSRIKVFQFYNYYQTNDEFLWGSPDLYRYMMDKLGAGGVENGIICIILDWGIIFTIPILLLLFKFQFHKLSVYSKFDKWLLLAVFFIIGTMNPNLAEPYQWTLWIFTYYAFRPLLTTKTVNSIFS